MGQTRDRNGRTSRIAGALGAAAVVATCCGAASGQQLEEGGVFFIAQDSLSERRLFFLTGGPGADLTITPLSATYQAGTGDLPPVIGVNPLEDRAEVLAAVGGEVVGWTVFGLSGSESAGIWGTGGVAIEAIAGFEDPLFGFEDPLFGFDVSQSSHERDDYVARHELGWIGFGDPIVELDGADKQFDNPIISFGPDGLRLLERSTPDGTPAVAPGTEGYDVRGVTGFTPGLVATDPRPDLPGQRPGMAMLVGPSRGVFPSIVGIWGTTGTAYDGIDGESVWGSDGASRVISEGGLLEDPVAMIPWATGWNGVNDSFVVLDNGSGLRGGGSGPRLVGVMPNGEQRLITQGGNLVSPTDLAVLPDGTLVVSDAEGAGGFGAIVLVDPATGEQTELAAGGFANGFFGPFAVGVARCAKPTFVVSSTADTVDANVGDGIPEDVNGNRTLRAAVMEANASPCGAIIDLTAVSVTIAIPGPDEDGSATGDLDITGCVSIFGAGREGTRISGNGLDRVFDVRPGGSLTLEDLEVTGGFVDASGGGGIRSDEASLVLNRVLVESNRSPGGVGGVLTRAGDLVAIDTEVGFNDGGAGTGGVGQSQLGGVGPTTLLARCLVRSNSTNGNAGGIRASSGVLEMVNVTVSGNGADRNGGGLTIDGDAVVTLDHCTVAGNQADADGQGGFSGGGIYQFDQSPAVVRLRSTIVADNETHVFDPENLSGDFESLGYNVLEEAGGAVFTGSTGLDQLGVDPMLAPLADNGGVTPTHAIGAGSPAVDAADPATTTSVDQRGIGRPIDGDYDAVAGPDVGAVEFVAPTCAGDVDGDGDTDVFDFADLASGFGAGPGATRAEGDLTGDGFVDVFDFADLASDFGCDVTP